MPNQYKKFPVLSKEKPMRNECRQTCRNCGHVSRSAKLLRVCPECRYPLEPRRDEQEEHDPFEWISELETMVEERESTINRQQAEIERLRVFARYVHSDTETPAHLHDAASKLLDLPSLAYGYDEEKS